MSSGRRSTSGLEHNGWSKRAQAIRRLPCVLCPLAGFRRLRFSFFANEPGPGNSNQMERMLSDYRLLIADPWQGLVAQLVRARA